MITVTIPKGHETERQYVVDLLFGEFLGLDVPIEIGSDEHYKVHGPSGRTIIIEDHFFGGLTRDASTSARVPETAADLKADGVTLGTCPVIYGRNSITFSAERITIGLDLFGSAYFMLSRWEEAADASRDGHGRFPASASLASRAGFLSRPVVDEYAALLFSCIERLWPGVERRRREGQVQPTCDVDEPFDSSLGTPRRVLRRVAGDMLKRRSLRTAALSVRNAYSRLRGDYSRDPNNTFGWLMDISERNGRVLTFYFISGRTSPLDGCYSLDDPYIIGILQSIAARGHGIGTHGSYNSGCGSDQLALERTALQATCIRAGIPITIDRNRQHYLRWNAARTPAMLERAGYKADSTGGYADQPGFRYGTARPFRMWDLASRRALKLKQQPLILMEGTVIDPTYLGAGRTETAVDTMLMLKNRAIGSGGDFVFLWHNNRLCDPRDREIFEELVR
jgi:hypothetical protein